MDNETLMALIKQQGQILEYLVAKEMGLNTKAPATVQTAQKLHGLTGTFSTLGLDRDIINAHLHPTGIAEILPLFPSVEEDPRYGALTGISDDVGSEPSNPCDNAPSGFIKACNLTAQFGRVQRDTETIDIDKVMLKINRGDFTDLILHGYRLGMEGPGMMPKNVDTTQMVNLLTMSQMVGAAERIYRVLMKHNWQGSPANNNSGGGYKEYPGLENQVKTGQKDADSGTTCEALDSYVANFAYQAITSNSGTNIVQALSAMEYIIYTKAEDSGMLPARWVLVMRPQVFYELTSIWPILYNSDKVSAILGSTVGNIQVSLDGRANVQDRDAMRAGKYLMINGRRYDVITDPGMTETNNINDANVSAGSYASSIFFVPLTVTGNFPVLYRQYLNYQMADSEIVFLRGKEDFWTDDGIFMWALEQIKWCFKLSVKTEQRIVLRTPQLAGRLDNVLYTPVTHVQEFDPDSVYWKNGGVSVRSVPSKNAVWL